MESLFSVIKTLKLPKEIKKNLEIFYEIQKNWDEILGDKSKTAFPLCVEKGTLYIAVQDHYDLQNFNSNYLAILRKINDLLKKREASLPLQKLKFLYAPKGRGVEKIRKNIEAIRQRQFSDEAWAGVERSLSRVGDIDLRESLRDLLKSYRKVWSLL